MQPLFYFRDPAPSSRMILAGAKAPDDVRTIVGEMGFKDFSLLRVGGTNPLSGLVSGVLRLAHALLAPFLLPSSCRFFIQFPGPFTCSPTNFVFFRLARRLRGARLIALIHDIDTARGWAEDNAGGLTADMRRLLGSADAVIVHNDAMAGWLSEHGIDRGKLVSLEIFDYLAEGFEPAATPSFSGSVTIAGNLGMDKSSYLATIGDIPGVDWHLYGMKYDPARIVGPRVRFHGCFPAEEIPKHLVEGFGLVWDGDSPDTCAGGTGAYLRINNPHKLSLFLTAGLPVVIWDQAAEAAFVRDNRVGLAVPSLADLGNLLAKISADDYAKMKSRAIELSKKLRSGYFTKKAITKALEKIR